jgi:hypothetical protein
MGRDFIQIPDKNMNKLLYCCLMDMGADINE